jgi:hypothetical protein
VWVGAWPGDPKWVGANPGHRNERFRSHRQGMIGPDEKSKLQTEGLRKEAFCMRNGGINTG